MKDMERLTTVKSINASIEEDLDARIMADEKIYQQSVNKLARQIAAGKGSQLIMLAGPSASGKTTTAHILRHRLADLGVGAVTVSLDDFYFGPHEMSTDENGEYDFESVHSLDLDLMHDCFMDLLSKGESDFPAFDFMVARRSSQKNHVCLKPGDVAIVEGIHALNPLIVETLPADRLLKLYISIESRVTDENGEKVLSQRSIRLARRMSRDFIYRNSSAENTLKMWDGVIAGEKKYLFPYSDTADYNINTFHSYEPAVFKGLILNIMQPVSKETTGYKYGESMRLGLEKFVSLSHKNVPHSSLLREFIER